MSLDEGTIHGKNLAIMEVTHSAHPISGCCRSETSLSCIPSSKRTFGNGNQMMAVTVELGADFVAGQPRLVFEDDYESGVGLFVNYDVAPDGKSFLMIKRTTEPPREINVVLNWLEELKRLAFNE